MLKHQCYDNDDPSKRTSSQVSRPVYIALAKNIYLRTQISLMLLEAAFN